jgi:hypothetical protein
VNYVVSVDLEDVGGPTIHGDWCAYWKNRKPGARTFAWRGPVPSYAKAVEIARREVRTTPVQYSPPCCTPRENAVQAGEADPTLAVTLKPMPNGAWLDAVPSAGDVADARWNAALRRLGTAMPPPRAFTGVGLTLALDAIPGDPARALVASAGVAMTILVDQNRWLGNQRTALKWWCAGLALAAPPGTTVQAARDMPACPVWATELLLDETLTGERDELEPALVRALAGADRGAWSAAPRLAVTLQWGDRTRCVAAAPEEWLRSGVAAALASGAGSASSRAPAAVHWIGCERAVTGLERTQLRLRVHAAKA